METGGQIPSTSSFSLKEQHEEKERNMLERKQVVFYDVRWIFVWKWEQINGRKLTFSKSWQDGVLPSAHGPGTLLSIKMT